MTGGRCCGIATIAIWFGLAGVGFAQHVFERVLVKVNGDILTLQEIDERIRSVIAQEAGRGVTWTDIRAEPALQQKASALVPRVSSILALSQGISMGEGRVLVARDINAAHAPTHGRRRAGARRNGFGKSRAHAGRGQGFCGANPPPGLLEEERRRHHLLQGSVAREDPTAKARPDTSPTEE